jgi:methionyl aminopeptidase
MAETAFSPIAAAERDLPARPERAPGRNDACWCGSGKKYKKCHLGLDRMADSGTARRTGRRVRKVMLKSAAQIEGIRRACRLTVEILDRIGERVRPGVTTADLDRWVYESVAARGATPAPLGYKGYPKSICTSINEVVCHGIPGPRELAAGDIVNVDVTTVLDGFYGDSSRMYLVGEVDPEARRLVETARECLDLGVAAVAPGARLGDLGAAIQEHAEAAGYSVVETFGGHGTGLAFHEEPFVAHFGRRGKGPLLVPGMVFTVEPMINAGRAEVEILSDGWTAVTADGSLSAQWEHTVAVTEDGVDVLTL